MVKSAVRKGRKRLAHQEDPKIKDGVVKLREKLTSRQKQRLKKRFLKSDEPVENRVSRKVFEPSDSLLENDGDELMVDDFGRLSDLEDEDIKTNTDPVEPVDENEDMITNLASEDVVEKSVMDSSTLNQRIRNWLYILSDFKNRAPADLNRSLCVRTLISDLCSRYSYNQFLMVKLLDLFPKEIVEVLEANEVDRPVTIRTNTLKTRRRELAQALINRGVNLDPLEPWSKVGLVVYSSQVPLGATPEYLAGHYILQGASSMLPVMALSPQLGERILDLCAAPGGKTTYIAQLMKNTGTIFANEINPSRAKALLGNCHRMGVTNTVICTENGRKFPKIMSNFDRVLVDAPCSGTGIIAKDPSVKTTKNNDEIQKCVELQKRLLVAAIDSCKVGGYVVYSTCSILVEENENVVNFALRRRKVRLEETKLFGEKGFTAFKGYQFHPHMTRVRRFYPHKHNVDGFFVAKMKKMAATVTRKKEVP
ncbi:putative nucleolar protein nol1/nop2 [Schistosoma mansoni]|nr:putative nucleolar protein nol1/nop2 [Schistosoma mansoni]|eukprot:XP_018648544.1 putative nucleolar protein nol1/nop2 [Schistosoma mansoni]